MQKLNDLNLRLFKIDLSDIPSLLLYFFTSLLLYFFTSFNVLYYQTQRALKRHSILHAKLLMINLENMRIFMLGLTQSSLDAWRVTFNFAL